MWCWKFPSTEPVPINPYHLYQSRVRTSLFSFTDAGTIALPCIRMSNGAFVWCSRVHRPRSWSRIGCWDGSIESACNIYGQAYTIVGWICHCKFCFCKFKSVQGSSIYIWFKGLKIMSIPHVLLRDLIWLYLLGSIEWSLMSEMIHYCLRGVRKRQAKWILISKNFSALSCAAIDFDSRLAAR